MRDGFEAARDTGINLAFMGANDAYWQVQLRDGGRIQSALPDRRPALDSVILEAGFLKEVLATDEHR